MLDIQELYAHIYSVFKSDKARIETRQNTVNDEFDKVELTGWHTYISGVENLITCEGDACLIGIFFMRFDLADNHGAADLFSSVLGGIFKLDEVEGAFSFHTLALGAFLTFSDSLT